MPCNSDYLNPNARESALRETAKLYLFALKKSGIENYPSNLKRAAETIYCNYDFVVDLCEFLTSLNTEMFNHVVYDAKDPLSRKLADWWEEHKAADEKRKARAAWERCIITRREYDILFHIYHVAHHLLDSSCENTSDNSIFVESKLKYKLDSALDLYEEEFPKKAHGSENFSDPLDDNA